MGNIAPRTGPVQWDSVKNYLSIKKIRLRNWPKYFGIPMNVTTFFPYVSHV